MGFQISKEEKLLLQFLRVAIGTSELEVMPEGIDWYELFGISERHGVNAVVLDGFGKYRLNSISLKKIITKFCKTKTSMYSLGFKN